MKILLALFAILTVGCTTYPKNYVYSPTVNVSGNNNDAVLPSPFAKNSPKTISTNKSISTYKTTYYGPEPTPLTTYVPPPPPSVDYYYQPQQESQIVFETSYPNRW